MKTDAAPLRRFDWYQRFQAWALAHGNRYYEGLVEARKRALFSPLAGVVVEIGPGPGANLPFFSPSVRWFGVEPNSFSRDLLQQKAAALGLEATVRDGTAEHLPFEDHSADAVVSTLVLCSVLAPSAVLAEILRVLKPGGSFVFIEHVAAPQGTGLRGLQQIAKPFWSLLADGCHPNRDTAAAIAAAGFRDVQIEPFRVPVPVVAPHIAGVARS